MKLVIAIIDDKFSQDVVRALIDSKIRTTKLASTGGFLKKGNTTLLIGVEEGDLLSVISLIRKNINTLNNSNEDEGSDTKGANLFVLDIDSYERI